MRLYMLAVLWYVLSNVYIVWRTYKFLGKFKEKKAVDITRKVISVIYTLSALTMVVAFFLPEGEFHKDLQRFANYFEGFMIYTLLFFVMIELIRLVMRFIKPLKKYLTSRKFSGAVAIIAAVLIVGFSVYGAIHSSHLKVNSYSVTVDKAGGSVKSLKVVLIADTHMGYSVGAKRIKAMADLVNAQKPDLVLFAGDVFDNTVAGLDDKDAIREALSGIKAQYGKYVSWGNHDIDERLFSGFTVSHPKDQLRSEAMDKYIESCGFTPLVDKSVFVADSFWLVGRKDYSKAGDGTSDRADLKTLLKDVDQSKPVLLMDHEPKFLEENAKAGVDLMFSGHTHDGQIFPINLFQPLLWENPVGELKVGNMTSYVTAGVGVYGPDMRVATDADITVVNVTFK